MPVLLEVSYVSAIAWPSLNPIAFRGLPALAVALYPRRHSGTLRERMTTSSEISHAPSGTVVVLLLAQRPGNVLMQCGSITSALPPHAQRIVASRAARIGASVIARQLLQVGQRDDRGQGLPVPGHDRSLIRVGGAVDYLREASSSSFRTHLAQGIPRTGCTALTRQTCTRQGPVPFLYAIEGRSHRVGPHPR